MLNGKENSANSVLDVQVTETESANGVMDLDKAEEALKHDISEMKANPQLAKDYVSACELIKVGVPDAVKRILS